MTVYLVSHFHWDREWYRPWQAFRARLVDAVDQVLDLAEADPEYRFVLDGQTVVLEDYAEIRPGRVAALERHVGAGALAIGPWYVQPDSLIPSGEAHIRNLLLGRRRGARFGPVSRVAYVPDSFGHPAQFPQLFAGFGLDGFVYWRGNGGEIDDLGPRWRWRAPDGSEVRALLLSEGYFSAARLDPVGAAGPASSAARLQPVVERLRAAGETPVVLMNGFDHTRPDRFTGPVAAALTERLEEPVARARLDDVVAAAPPTESLPVYEGALVGARLANLLPGVWSARMPIKLRNRRVEAVLEQWAEPWSALGTARGLPDERASLEVAWGSLLQNQAHDSICGCSADATHDRMEARFDDAERLGVETTHRVLQRLAGRPPIRELPWSDEQTVVVFNPSPHLRTDVVQVSLDLDPALTMSVGEPSVHPLAMALFGGRGFTLDDRPVSLVPAADPSRPQWLPDQPPLDIELVARDVPAFGCRRYRLRPGDAVVDEVDDGSEIRTDDVRVRLGRHGTLDVDIGADHWAGLFGLEDVGDRGDSYDHDPVGLPTAPHLDDVVVERRRRPTGVQTLSVTRRIELPSGLDPDRRRRRRETVPTMVAVECRVVPGVDRVDARVKVVNRAGDHRLRLLFPTGAEVDRFDAATTLDAAVRTTEPVSGAGWVHPVPSTFCHQGWISAGRLTVSAPGLPEAEVTPDGVVALTLVRSVGWLSRYDLQTRPVPAGPAVEAPGAQTLGAVEASVSLLARSAPADTARRTRDAEAGLWGVLGGPEPRLEPGRPLLRLEGDGVVLSALKPADDGEGLVTRVLNPTDQTARARIHLGFAVGAVEGVRLDELPDDRVELAATDGGLVTVEVPARSLRSIRLRPV